MSDRRNRDKHRSSSKQNLLREFRTRYCLISCQIMSFYVREPVGGVDDARNVMKKRSMGYEPCKKEDHPEIPTWGNPNGNEVEIGGLMLHKVPKDVIQAKKDFVAKRTSDQSEAVDANLYRQSDPRMPIISDKKSTTTRGRG